MKRALILVALVVAVVAFAGWARHSLADPPQHDRYSGPDFGKDPPPPKKPNLTEILHDLFA